MTLPTPAMREVMAGAKVGDDVFGEDPSLLILEETICKMFGTEMAMFTPTATMSNQIAIKLLTHPMDEIICDRTAHIYNYEVGGFAFHSGCSIRYLNGERGVFTPDDVLQNINDIDVHKAVTRLVNIENTSNRGGGKVFPLQHIQDIRAVCDSKGLHMHMDGSRIFNAMIASGDIASDFGKNFDTITLCFSKGLGCPMGSVLTGKKEFMHQARRVRKVMGGGMRQAGIAGAACLYALENNIDRLIHDHVIAKKIGKTLSTLNYVEEVIPVETNIIIFRLKATVIDKDFITYLATNNVHAFAFGENCVRFVTHLDINEEMLPAINRVLQSYL